MRDVIAVLDHFGLHRAVIAGHSLGAYIAARLATLHPDRVDSLVLVDGGLTIPESEGVDPEKFMEAFLGPTLARLKMTFADLDAYHAWWAEHPAVAGADIDDADLTEYAAHDLVGEPGRCARRSIPRSSATTASTCSRSPMPPRWRVPAVLLCAPRGMVDDPNPMQPLSLVQAWAAAGSAAAPRDRGARRQPLHDRLGRPRRSDGGRRDRAGGRRRRERPHA